MRSGADGVVAGAQLDPPPSDLTAPCDTPPPLPSPATRSAVTKALGAAYVELRVCRDRHSGLVRFIEDRDARVRGTVLTH